jgi:hypothetical protein
MRINNLDGSGWWVVVKVDEDDHLTFCAGHENGNAPEDITDDIFDWDEEFGVRLSANQEVEA